MNILEIQLQSADILYTRKFYEETLGMRILDADGSSLKIAAGFSLLIFNKTENKKPYYHFAFNIPANQFEEAHAWASQRVQLLPVTPGNTIADFKNWNAKAFYFYDNNRNIVEFIARFDLNNASNKPFNGSSVFSVSEIGIVTDNAKVDSRKIMEEYGLNYFFRQPPQDDFVAVGDDNGLLIIVDNNRNWYPTQQPSGKYGMAIKAGHNGKTINIEMEGG
jgi:catechol-2,3-dioxygenase